MLITEKELLKEIRGNLVALVIQYQDLAEYLTPIILKIDTFLEGTDLKI